MEPKSETPKLPDMVMCGDHPSFTKTELNMKEKPEEKEKKNLLHSKISPSSSRTAPGAQPGRGEARLRAASEHALRAIEARRRARSLEAVPPPDLNAGAGNRALMQAALGSFRWPPYLLAVWVCVLVLTHALHSLVSVLERALPAIKKFAQYFRFWTEESWRSETEREIGHHLFTVALAFVTGCLYCLFSLFYVLHAIALWAVEPLASDLDDKVSEIDAKVTDYEELSMLKH